MPTVTALITGASSGIGEVFAELCAQDRTNLILVARSQDKLQALADRLRQAHGIQTLVIPTDLSQVGAAQRLFDQITSAGWTVDQLFNNAGFGSMGYFEELPIEKHAELLQVNVIALTELTRLFLPAMVTRKSGQILNVASTASFQPGPNACVYYASKAYVRYFSEGLQEELAGTGVTVTCLAPGPTRTNFSEVAAMTQTPVFRYNSMDVRDVAAIGYRALCRGKTLVVPGLANKLLQLSSKFSHWGIVKKVMKHVMQPLPPRGTAPRSESSR
ncbi:MAG: SDR family oxidoreductase [Planctomycetota bacterium]|nr:MAG: SDR family oxidoreductase [Planctomycetota bacterium]